MGDLTPIVPQISECELFNMPRQNLPECYEQTGAFDAYRIDDILSGRINGNKIKAFEQSGPVIDIDNLIDLKLAKQLLKNDPRSYDYGL